MIERSNRHGEAITAEFWSSAEYDTFMKALICDLRRLNVSATERFHLSTGRYRSAKGKAQKVLLRAQMYCGYPLRLLASCVLHPEVRVRVVTTNTFYAPIVAAIGQRISRTRLIHLVYDLFPDALFVAGTTHPNSIISRICDGVVRKTFKAAAANIFLGRRLLAHAENRFGPIPRADVIPVGADGTPFERHRPTPPSSSEAISILYCGNLGRLHDIDTLLDALNLAQGCSGRKVRISFNASGFGLSKVERYVDRAGTEGAFSVSTGGFLEGEAWTKRMRQSQIALVTMRPGAEKVLMPSKTYSALVAGQAILAICPAASDLADLVREHACGWVVEPGDSQKLFTLLRFLQESPEVIQTCRENAFAAGHKFFSGGAIALKWKAVLEAVQLEPLLDGQSELSLA